MFMKILKKSMPILTALLLFIGCSKEPAVQNPVPDGPGPEDETVTFDFAVSSLVSTLSAPASGIDTTKEQAINNLWVIQYDGEGNNMLSSDYYKTDEIANQGTYWTVSVAVQKLDKSKLYFVANVGPEYFVTTAPAATANAFEESTLDFANWGSADVDDNGLPMYGSYEGPTTEAPTEQIPLKRMVARVALECKVELDSKETSTSNGTRPADKLTLTRVQIMNAATKVQYLPHTNTTTTIYPANASNADLSDNYRYYDAEDVSGSVDKVWYLPENLKGQNTDITEDSQKGGANVPAGSTYVQIDGDYETAKLDQEKGQWVSMIEPVSYCIYLGEDSKIDFNVVRNYSYKITVTIKGMDKTDTRVIVDKGVPAGEYVDGEWANSEE